MGKVKLSHHIWGLLLIFFLSLVVLELERTNIEEDLRLRGQIALHDEGIHWAWLSLSGRDAFLHGAEGRNAKVRKRAVEVVNHVYGIRSAKDVSKSLKRVTPYIWSASRKDGRLKLSKFALSHDDKQTIVGIAKALLPGLNIEDKMTVALGAVNEDRWLASVNYALQQLRYVEKGYVTVTDKGVKIHGRASDTDSYVAFVKNIKENKPKNIKVIQARVRPPKARPYSWAIAAYKGKVVLEGHVPDLETREKLINILEFTAQKGPVVDNLVYASGHPHGWRETVEVLIRQFCSLEKGIITLSDKTLIVSGFVKDSAANKKIQSELQASLPKGIILKNNVKVKEKESNNNTEQESQVQLQNSSKNF